MAEHLGSFLKFQRSILLTDPDVVSSRVLLCHLLADKPEVWKPHKETLFMLHDYQPLIQFGIT